MRKLIFAASLAALAGTGLATNASARTYEAWGHTFYDASFHPQSPRNADVASEGTEADNGRSVASEGTEADNGRSVASLPAIRPLFL